MIILLKLSLAHFIGDFFLQPNGWVKSKQEKKWVSPFLYLHIVVHGLLILFFVGFFFWKQMLILISLHLLVDGAKLQFQKAATRRAWFFTDQVLHILTIIVVWGIYSNTTIDYNMLANIKTVTFITAALFLITPTSIIIKTIISKWSPETQDANDNESLQRAGTWIGALERLLILIFICNGKWEGVGFLLAAKSIFRFGNLKESKDRKLTEYILIGTLLSFGIAIAVSIAGIYISTKY